MFNLDWKYAYTGRLTMQQSNRLPDLAKRLHREASDGSLPYLTMPYLAELEADMLKLEPKLKKFKHMVVLGIGGSALGARALQKAFFPQQDRPGHSGPYLWIMDNVDADAFFHLLNNVNYEETVFVVISKSGGTIETLSQYFFVRQWLQAKTSQWADHLVFVTDKSVGFLRQEAQARGITALTVPENLGGRYSIVSAVGVIPAAFMGMDWRAFLAGSIAVNAPLVSGKTVDMEQHSAWKMANWAYNLEQADYNQLIFFSYIPAWGAFGQWFMQLWAESLGKDGRGTMPIAAVGVTDQHSTQQMFLDGPADKGCIHISCPNLDQGQVFPTDIPAEWQWLAGKKFGALLTAEGLGTAAALSQKKVPLLQMQLDKIDEFAAGSLMGLFMTTTILTGWLLDINPIDQPAVELGKRLAYAKLGAGKYPDELKLMAEF